MTSTKSALRILIASFVLLALVGMPAAAADTTVTTTAGDATSEVIDGTSASVDAPAAENEDCYWIVDPDTGQIVGVICVE